MLGPFMTALPVTEFAAFHIVADNYITGDREEFEQLFMIPGIDMVRAAVRVHSALSA